MYRQLGGFKTIMAYGNCFSQANHFVYMQITCATRKSRKGVQATLVPSHKADCVYVDDQISAWDSGLFSMGQHRP